MSVRRTKKKSGEPKGPKSAYLCFCSEARVELKEKEPELVFGAVTQRLSALWKQLSKSDRERYEEEAREDRARFAREMTDYKKNNPNATVKEDGSDDDGDEDDGDGNDDDDGAVTTKKKRSRKAPKDENEPKRAVTAFFHYSAENRPLLREHNPSMKFGDFAKALSANWKALSEKERAPYEEKARIDRERYRQEREDYEKTKDEPLKLPAPKAKRSSSSETEKPKAKSSSSSSKEKPKSDTPNGKPKMSQTAAFKYFAETCKPDIRRLTPGLTAAEFQAAIVDRWQKLSEKKRKIYEQCARRDAQRKQRAAEKRRNGELPSSDDDDDDDDEDDDD